MEEKKLQKLLEDMSLQEKIEQLVQLNGLFFGSSEQLTGPAAAFRLSEGQAYRTGSVLGEHGAARLKKLQDRMMAEQPHHIPALFMADVIHGYRTAFPVPIAIGSSFNPSLARRIAEAAAREAAAAGLHVTFSPMADLVHDSHGVSTTIHNPTEFDAAPLIRFTGTGSFTITKPAQHAADAMQIGVTLDNTNAQTIEIDCKSYAVNYVETVAGVEMRSNASAAIRYLTTYPTLTRIAAGENIVRLEPFDVMHPAQLTKFEIIPRWWTA